MFRRIILLSLWVPAAWAAADTIEVRQVSMAGPYTVSAPLLTDSLDCEGKPISTDDLLFEASPKSSTKGKDVPLPLTFPKASTQPTPQGEGKASPQLSPKGEGVKSFPLGEDLVEASSLGEESGEAWGSDGNALYLMNFTMQNTGFAKGKVNVKCQSKHKLYIDGDEGNGEFELLPGRHEVSIKLLQKTGENDTVSISLESSQPIETNPQGKRYWTNADLMHGERISGVSLSSTGKYARIRKSITYKGGETGGKDIFIDLSTGKEFALDGFQRWLPEECRVQ